VLFSLALFVSPALVAAEAAKKTFTISSDDAVRTLKQFAAQSGEQLLYSPDEVSGVTTKAVEGTMTAREALEKMIAGTKLAVAQDKTTGALAVKRASDPNAPRAAQNSSDRPGETKPELGVVQLDTFEVMGSKVL